MQYPGAANARGIINGAFYEVTAFSNEGVAIKMLDPPPPEGEEPKVFEVHIDHLKHLRLGWAITYFSSQSRTLRGHVRLWDVQNLII